MFTHPHHVALGLGLGLGLAVAVAGCTAGDDVHAPIIASIVPARGVPGTTVTITGSYFCAQPVPTNPDDVDPLACAHVGTVTFGAVPATLGQYTDTSITAEVPVIDIGTVDVVVSVDGRRSLPLHFVVE